MDVMIVGGDECRAAVVVFWGSEMEAERERRLSTAFDNLEPMFQRRSWREVREDGPTRIFEPQGSRRYKGISGRYFVDSPASDGSVGSALTCHTL